MPLSLCAVEQAEDFVAGNRFAGLPLLDRADERDVFHDFGEQIAHQLGALLEHLDEGRLQRVLELVFAR